MPAPQRSSAGRETAGRSAGRSRSDAMLAAQSRAETTSTRAPGPRNSKPIPASATEIEIQSARPTGQPKNSRPKTGTSRLPVEVMKAATPGFVVCFRPKIQAIMATARASAAGSSRRTALPSSAKDANLAKRPISRPAMTKRLPRKSSGGNSARAWIENSHPAPATKAAIAIYRSANGWERGWAERSGVICWTPEKPKGRSERPAGFSVG